MFLYFHALCVLAGTDTGIAIYNKYASDTMDSSKVGIAAHLGGMGTGRFAVFCFVACLSVKS